MPGTKRPRVAEDEEGGSGADTVHPSRKQRLESGEVNAELSKILNELRDEIQAVRLDATRKLLKNLSTKSSDRAQRLDYSLTRLIKGVCSGAKAARPGFSIALVEVLRLGFASELKLIDVVDKTIALTSLGGRTSSDEKRDYLIGRKFAIQAILRSEILIKATDAEAKYLFDAVTELASQKEWLRGECGAMLHDFLTGQEVNQMKNETARILIDSWIEKGLLKSPEGVAIWLALKRTFPEVKLPKGHWHHNNPLSSQERVTLSKILLTNAIAGDEDGSGTSKRSGGARQVRPSFAWQVILSYLYTEDSDSKFISFWEDCVAKPMFSSSSSTERKSLGLQIFTQAIATTPAPLLGHVVHANIVRCIVDQRAKSDRYLFEAAKLPLNQMSARAKNESAAASSIACKLLAVIPSNIDKLMKTTVETTIVAATSSDLGSVVSCGVDLCQVPGSNEPDEAARKRKMLADILLSLVRSKRSVPAQLFTEGHLADWLKSLLQSLARLGYTTASEQSRPPVSAETRVVFRERLTSCLGQLVTLPLDQAVVAPSAVIEALHEMKKLLETDMSEQSTATLKEARKLLKEASKKAKNGIGSFATVERAFQLLFSLGMLQVYQQEADSVGVLQDVTACYQSPRDTSDSSVMLVELLLSFVSKPSTLFRKLAEQVFAAFAPEISAESLQSMIDILSQKESLAGQQELFDENVTEKDGENEDLEDEDMEAIDVEDESDIEIINGNIAGKDEESDAESSDKDARESDDSSEPDEDEEAAFDRKLADALGTTGMDDDEDEDGSDMDDEQMMALEPHLTNIFKERKKDSNKKQENKDAKENIVNFKNRVLDLLAVYVKSQHANPIALDLIHPLTTLTRTTSSQPTAKKAFEVLEQHFDTCKKNKHLPEVGDARLAFALLSAVHDEMRLGGSRLHATACSRSSQFLAKILVTHDLQHLEKIHAMYGKLLVEWRGDAKSKIPPSVFNDWHNWYMQK